ncbi:MAG: RtcB family protein, partial [Candidatus Paceibacteria bacterium]
MKISKKDLVKISEYLWEIPRDFRPDMLTPARVYISEKMLNSLFKDRTLDQLMNTAAMPGVVKYSIVMPDAHEGYGFPIGGVVAMRTDSGLISPGGIGY